MAFLSPPTFDHARITRARALALVRDCEGDDLVDFGPVPATYQAFERDAGNWEGPLSFASGYMFVVVGQCEDYHLYVLSDDLGLLRANQVETYCGWPVVTRIDGKMVSKEHACDEGGTSIKFTMKWRTTVYRMRADTGDLERVLRGMVYAEAWMGNVEVGADDANIDYAANFSVLGYVGSPAAPHPPPSAARPSRPLRAARPTCSCRSRLQAVRGWGLRW